MTSATYFKTTCKVGLAAIISCSGMTMFFGAILVGEKLSVSLLVAFFIQVGAFLGL
jgi:hypothetical protein